MQSPAMTVIAASAFDRRLAACCMSQKVHAWDRPSASAKYKAKRLRSFADAGVTDVSIRVVPIGDGRDELIASMKRTRAYLASLEGSL